MQFHFLQWLNAGMEETAEKYNITLKIQDANDDTNTQVNQVETFIQQGVDMNYHECLRS